MSATTQLQTYALPGRRFGSFLRPVVIQKRWTLPAAQRLTWALYADVSSTFVLPADGSRRFTLEV